MGGPVSPLAGPTGPTMSLQDPRLHEQSVWTKTEATVPSGGQIFAFQVRRREQILGIVCSQDLGDR